MSPLLSTFCRPFFLLFFCGSFFTPPLSLLSLLFFSMNKHKQLQRIKMVQNWNWTSIVPVKNDAFIYVRIGASSSDQCNICVLLLESNHRFSVFLSLINVIYVHSELLYTQNGLQLPISTEQEKCEKNLVASRKIKGECIEKLVKGNLFYFYAIVHPILRLQTNLCSAIVVVVMTTWNLIGDWRLTV